MQTGFSKWSKLMGVGAVMMIAVAGCSSNSTTDDGSAEGGSANPLTNTPGTMGNSLRGAGAAAGNVADNVATAAGNAATAAGKEVQGAGNAISNAASGVAGAGRSAVMTPNVKEAIGDKVPTTNIDVDTNGDTKTITLKGSVANAAQVKLAGTIAQKEAPDYKIVNNLKAAGGASPMMKKP